jgi:hypothetical protein
MSGANRLLEADDDNAPTKQPHGDDRETNQAWRQDPLPGSTRQRACPDPDGDEPRQPATDSINWAAARSAGQRLGPASRLWH